MYKLLLFSFILINSMSFLNYSMDSASATLGNAKPSSSSSKKKFDREKFQQSGTRPTLRLESPTFNLLMSPYESQIIKNHTDLMKELAELKEKPTLYQRLDRAGEEVVVRVFSQVLSQLLMAGIVGGANWMVQRFSKQDPSENPKAVMQQLNMELMVLQGKKLQQDMLINQQKLAHQKCEELKYLDEKYEKLLEKTFNLEKREELQKKREAILDQIADLTLLKKKSNNTIKLAPNAIPVH